MLNALGIAFEFLLNTLSIRFDGTPTFTKRNCYPQLVYQSHPTATSLALLLHFVPIHWSPLGKLIYSPHVRGSKCHNDVTITQLPTGLLSDYIQIR